MTNLSGKNIYYHYLTPVLAARKQNSYEVKKRIEQKNPNERNKINKSLILIKSVYVHYHLLKFISANQMKNKNVYLITSKTKNLLPQDAFMHKKE